MRQCFDTTYDEVLLSEVYGLDVDTLRGIDFAKNVRNYKEQISKIDDAQSYLSEGEKNKQYIS